MGDAVAGVLPDGNTNCPDFSHLACAVGAMAHGLGGIFAAPVRLGCKSIVECHF